MLYFVCSKLNRKADFALRPISGLEAKKVTIKQRNARGVELNY